MFHGEILLHLWSGAVVGTAMAAALLQYSGKHKLGHDNLHIVANSI
jgi:hypothetical protein